LTLWPIIRARFPEACSSAGLWEQVFSVSIHGLVTCFAALPSTLANALPNLVPEVEVSRVRSNHRGCTEVPRRRAQQQS